MGVERLYTSVFIKRNNKVLLGLKTRGLGAGLWNGFGGKLENETLLDGAKRELKEECNVECKELKQIGIVNYKEENEPNVSVIHVFTTDQYTGEIRPSVEMNPIQWFDFRDIPFASMWSDAKLWFPSMLQDTYFSIHVTSSVDGTMSHTDIRIWNSLESLLNNHN